MLVVVLLLVIMSVAANGGDIASVVIGGDDYDSGSHAVIGVGLLKQEKIVERAGALSHRGLCSDTGSSELLSAPEPALLCKWRE